MTSAISILALGMMVGMGHAFEADHVAAVSSIVAGDSRPGHAVRHGLSWGLGHTITLLLFSGAALVLGQSIPGHIEARFEMIVGLMLVGLGAHLIWRLHQQHVHFHGHRHADRASHFHAHSHSGETAGHRASRHEHEHRFSAKALLVGMVHGLAGSASLLVLAASQIRDPISGVLYIAMFGLGSMLGMGFLSAAISLPMRLAERWLTLANRALQLCLACVTILVGTSSIVHHF